MKSLIREIVPGKTLYKDTTTGIAWIHDGASGCGISIHANIDASGSVRGMKKRGYWEKDARTIRSHGFVYNIDTFIHDWDEKSPMRKYEDIVEKECRCQACLERRSKSL